HVTRAPLDTTTLPPRRSSDLKRSVSARGPPPACIVDHVKVGFGAGHRFRAKKMRASFQSGARPDQDLSFGNARPASNGAVKRHTSKTHSARLLLKTIVLILLSGYSCAERLSTE